MSRKFATAVLALVLFVGCGNPGEGASVVTAPSQDSIFAEDGKPPPVPQRSLEQLRSELSQNLNVRSSPLGALCWARWELGRTVVLTAMDETVRTLAVEYGEADSEISDAGATSSRTQVADAARVVSGTVVLDEVTSGLPRELAPFADAFFAMAKEVADTDAAVLPDYDGLPGADVYVQMASESDDCVTP